MFHDSNTLKKAIKKDRELLLVNQDNPEFIKKWFDDFDPQGEYGTDVFEKNLRNIAKIKFTYPNKKNQ